MNKRVVLLANDTTYTYNLRLALIKELINQKYEIYIVAEILKFKDELESIGCHLINIDIGRHGTNPLSDFKLMKQYKKILKKIKPAYVLSYNIKPNVYGGMACKSIKTKFMPNITGLGTALEYPGIMQKITITLNKIGLKKANVVFFQNSENMSFFEKHKILSKRTKMVLLPGSGVDLEKHKLMNYPNDDKVKFLYIARIMKDKGIDIYLEAAKTIKGIYPNTEFHICGYCDDEKYKDILNQYEKDNVIIYHGEQKNMIPFFEMAHCIVHPSYYPEGMSNVLLEAAAHGRPIICTDRSGCRETVDDRKSGFIVPIKNVEEVVNSVEKIINMPKKDREKMGLCGRKKIEKEFDRNIVVNKYLNEIEDKKIKVLHILGRFQIGGAETYVMNILRNIDRNRYQFDFIVHGEDIGDYENEARKLGSCIYRITKYKLYNHLKYKKQLNDFFAKHSEYKIVHCHVRSTASLILKIAKKYGIKTIAHSHSTSNGKGLSSLIKNHLQKKIVRYADYQLSCSKEAAIWLYGKKCFNNCNCIVLKNGIDSGNFKYNKKYREEIRNKYSIKKDDLLIGHVGRFEDVKNHDFIVEIGKELIKNNSKIKFILCGSGSLKEKIMQRVSELSINNNFIFVEPTKDINKYYDAFDLFILPSKYEGLGIVLIEAQYSGLSCFVSPNISDEAIISTNVKRIDLNVNKWVKEIVSFSYNVRRSEELTEKAKEYDIYYTCGELCKIYSKLCRGELDEK